MSRVTFEEGVELFKNADLFDLQKRAVEVRNAKNPATEVTYVIDTNPNYTNACEADCLFCAFYRKPGDSEVYVKTLDEVRQFMTDAQKLNATTVLLQGGLHPDLPLDYYTDIISMTKEEFPEIVPHFFSAPEIQNIAEVCGMTDKEVLQKFYDAGQRSLPGGGAEILSQKVRNRISPKKQKVAKWLSIHEEAHEVGMRSTATMMYGHREEPEDVIEHLEAIRQIQDRTGGFTAFVPWSYKRITLFLVKKSLVRQQERIITECLLFQEFILITLIIFKLHGFQRVRMSELSLCLMALMTLAGPFLKRMFMQKPGTSIRHPSRA